MKRLQGKKETFRFNRKESGEMGESFIKNEKRGKHMQTKAKLEAKMKENIWLCITNLNNWKIIKKEKVYGFNEQNKLYYENLKKRDKVVMYVIPKRIGGLYEISNKNYTGNINLPDGKYPYRIQLKEELVPKELLDVTAKTIGSLSIFKHTIRWGTVLMGRSIIKLQQSDYNHIKRLIKNAEAEQDL